MGKTEFEKKLAEIYPEDYDVEDSHREADNLMVEELESLGYDFSVFKKAVRWYG